MARVGNFYLFAYSCKSWSNFPITYPCLEYFGLRIFSFDFWKNFGIQNNLCSRLVYFWWYYRLFQIRIGDRCLIGVGPWIISYFVWKGEEWSTFLGGILGWWVKPTPRFRAVRVSLQLPSILDFNLGGMVFLIYLFCYFSIDFCFVVYQFLLYPLRQFQGASLP